MSVENKKKWAIGAAVCLVIVVLAGLFVARQLAARTGGATAGGGYPGGGRRRMPGTRGKITTVSAGSLTIQPRNGGAQTFALTAATKITVDQKAVAAAGLKAGQRARVVSTDGGKTAAQVYVRTRPFGGGPPPPGGGRP